jgi:hypothetical protein
VSSATRGGGAPSKSIYDTSVYINAMRSSIQSAYGLATSLANQGGT